MFHVTSSVFGGVTAVAAWVLAAQCLETAKANIGADHEHAIPVAKADRIASPRTEIGSDHKVVTVEVVGVQDAAIVYRDRGGRVLFQTDPLTNITVISKGSALPQVSVRETSHSTPVPHNLDVAPAIPVGCDPVAAPYVEPALARVIGRCLS